MMNLVLNWLKVDSVTVVDVIWFTGQLYSAGADGTLKVRLVSDEHHTMSPVQSYQDFNNTSNKNIVFSLS